MASFQRGGIHDSERRSEMTDLRKKSGILYLSIALFLICAAAAAVMAFTALLTEKPIRERQKALVEENLKRVLPPFDAVSERHISFDDGMPESVLFLAEKDGMPAGKAVRTVVMSGYGGRVEALVGFDLSNRVRRIVVISHNETPGIGSRVMERKAVRRIWDVLRGKEAGKDLPANEALDSYEGKTGNELTEKNVHFISGATISSHALLDLVRRAADVLQEEDK